MNSLAEEIASDSIVLLENTGNLLPLASGTTIALFGRALTAPYYSGNGSGAARGGELSVTILDAACNAEKDGRLTLTESLTCHYRSEQSQRASEAGPALSFDQLVGMVNSGLMYEIFGRYTGPEAEPAVPDTLISEARSNTDTALIVLSRNSGGEECDRHLENDWYLTDSEKTLVQQVCTAFPHVIIVINANGLMDLSWTRTYPAVEALLFMGLPGEGGGEALIDILTGSVNPSGKLSVTIAEHYDDYPSAKHFSFEKDKDEILTYSDYALDAAACGSIKPDGSLWKKSPVTVYQEDIFNGYRYFDTFGAACRYSFGHGLSYTTFAVETVEHNLEPLAAGKTGSLVCKVTNTGTIAGKTVVLCYNRPIHALTRNQPLQKLVAFEKTPVLQCGESILVTLTVAAEDLATWHDDSAAWVFDADVHQLFAGTDSASLSLAASFPQKENLVISQGAHACRVQPSVAGKIAWLKTPESPVSAAADTHAPWPALDTYISDSIQQTVLSLSDDQLAALCVGWGPGVPFAAFTGSELPDTITGPDGKPLTCNTHPVGTKGYVSPAIPEKGIYSQLYQDGPASVGGTVWPTEMIAGCSFNKELLFRFGQAMASECLDRSINVWLAPALNLHRNPLCGRNFEYYSEDPYLAGSLAVAVIRGVQETGKTIVCPKHFAANEQETYRRGSARKDYDAVDSIITERALRELYLKPFEMAVRQGNVHCIMSSFNKINGTFAGGNAGLLTQILRNEWEFKGIVVTDWGDMDTVVDGAAAVAAGNDIIMPGGVPVIEQIRTGLAEGRVNRQQLEQAVCRLLYTVELTR